MEARAGNRVGNLGQFDAAQRCLLAAMGQSDPLVRRALGRAGLKYLAGAMGIEMEGAQQSLRAPSPTRHAGG